MDTQTNDTTTASGKLHARIESRKIYDFYLTGTIEECDDYIALYDTLSKATPDDILNIHINSPGGSIYDTIQFIASLERSAATSIAHIEGMCFSAATLIALRCAGIIVYDNSSFMCHNYAAGHYGKGHEITTSVEFEKRSMRALIEDSYRDFLTKKEIERLIKGEDFWFSPDELSKRLERRSKKHTKRENDTKSQDTKND